MRVQSFDYNILRYSAVYCNCDIIAIVKMMIAAVHYYNNRSNTLLQYY